MGITIQPLGGLAPDVLTPLVVESEQAGWRFVRRLLDDLRSGVNRFDKPGERLFVAVSGSDVVGVCGLNVDPYSADASVGRVRRLYVLSHYRSSGVGQRLVQHVIAAAAGRFHQLRVRTEHPHASRLYERLGFVPVMGMENCTHRLELANAGLAIAASPTSNSAFGSGVEEMTVEHDQSEPVNRYACPVCGYRGLWQPPYEWMPPTPYPEFGDPPYADRLGLASLEGCHGCGYQFGYDDDAAACGKPTSFRAYRQEWIVGGCRWWSSKPQPADWSPRVQMQAMGINPGDDAER